MSAIDKDRIAMFLSYGGTVPRDLLRELDGGPHGLWHGYAAGART